MTVPGPDATSPEAPRDGSSPLPRDVVRDQAFDLGYALRKNRWGVGALALALAALLLAIIVQPGIWQAPDWRYVAPPAALAVLAGMAAILRREPRWQFAVATFAIAGSAMVLGWVLIVVAILLGFFIALAILHEVF